MTSAVRFIRILLLIVAATYLGLYLVLAVLRISYPFELEWMEGSMVDHVQRILEGKSLYVAPTIEFVPFAYPPLYFYLAAGVAAITGIGYFPLRIISLVSSLAALWLIAALVRKETRRRSLGLLAAGMFAATYAACGAWLDIGRVDSLFLFLLLAAAYLLRTRETRGGAATAGLLLAAGFLTKQTAVVVTVPLLVYLALSHRRLFWWAAAPFLVVAAGTLVAMSVITHGWFWSYVFVQPSLHSIEPHAIRHIFTHDLLLLCVVVGAAVFWILRKNSGTEQKPRLFYGLFALGMLFASFLPRIKAGGFDNDLIPAYAALCILLGLAANGMDVPAPRSKPWHRLLVAFAPLACLAQLLFLAYDPREFVPTSADLIAGHALLQTIQSHPGDVLLLSHGYLARQAGKSPTANYIAVTDVMSAGDNAARTELLNSFHDAVSRKRYSAIILDDQNPLTWTEIGIAENYRTSGIAIENSDDFWPVSGWPTRPTWILVPKR
jgi:4-amino-4-deoxy-L-arabinose transferase-like glycosyltransferase